MNVEAWLREFGDRDAPDNRRMRRAPLGPTARLVRVPQDVRTWSQLQYLTLDELEGEIVFAPKSHIAAVIAEYQIPTDKIGRQPVWHRDHLARIERLLATPSAVKLALAGRKGRQAARKAEKAGR